MKMKLTENKENISFEPSMQTKDTKVVPWPLASLKIETPAAPPIECHELRNLC